MHFKQQILELLEIGNKRHLSESFLMTIKQWVNGVFLFFYQLIIAAGTKRMVHASLHPGSLKCFLVIQFDFNLLSKVTLDSGLKKKK